MAFRISAGVYPEIIDISQIISTAATSIGGIVIEAKRGPVGVPVRVTPETFEKVYGKDAILGKFGHQSALAFLKKAGTLYVVRVANGALFGGVTVTTTGITAWVTGKDEVVDAGFGLNDILYVYGKDQGDWNKGSFIRVGKVDAVEKTFELQVWTRNLEGVLVLRENHLVTRVVGKKDGHGRTMYVEDVVNASSDFIKVLDNTVLSEDVLPVTTPLQIVDTVTVKDSDKVALVGGSDGVGASTAETSAGWEHFRNPDNIPVTILINGGYADYVTQNKMIEIAEHRRDCFAILDTPWGMTVQQAIDFVKGTPEASLTGSSDALRRAAIYFDWVKVYDRTLDRIIDVPVSGFVASAFAYTDQVAEVWFAPAGVKRGTLSVLGVKTLLEQTDRDALYENRINPIRFKAGVGVSVWGQKTLQNYASALDRVAPVRMLMVIEKAVAIYLDAFTFDPNDEYTRLTITSMINDYLEKIQAKRGLYSFQVVCDGTNNSAIDVDNNTLNIHVMLQPTKAAEFINLGIVITKTGASFEESLAAAA